MHLDDVQPKTLVRYDKMLAQLNMLMTLMAGVSLDMLLRAQAGTLLIVGHAVDASSF